MTGSIGSYGASGASVILTSGIKSITDAQTAIAWEVSEGTTSQTIAGLGDSAHEAVSLSPKIGQISAVQGNLSSAQGRLSSTSTALNQIVKIAQGLSTQALSTEETQSGDSTSFSTLSDEAQSALTQLGTILNSTDGNGYIFSGSNSSDKTVPDPSGLSSGALAAKISFLVSGLTDDNLSDVISGATDAAADNSAGTSVFAGSLSVSGSSAADLTKSVVTGTDGSATQIGVVATQGGTKTSDSTGSPIRDLVRDLMILSSTKGMTSSTPGANQLLQNLHTSLTTTANKVIDMTTGVGVTQNSLTSRSTTLSSAQLMMKKQMTTNIGADLATVSSQSNTLQASLKATFMLITDMKGMTLANYL